MAETGTAVFSGRHIGSNLGGLEATLSTERRREPVVLYRGLEDFLGEMVKGSGDGSVGRGEDAFDASQG